MSKEYIESVLKRYGIESSIEFRKISYKKYRNHQTDSADEHYEYLFYAKLKKKDEVIYYSPLNYMGGKAELIPFLVKNEPLNYTKFIDLFGGGFNVGINSRCSNIIYNDCNFKVKQLIEMFRDLDTYDIYKYLVQNIKKYDLTKNGKDSYIKARNDYNHPEPPMRDSRLLYLLILYGFQQQIRFNSSLEYNNPVGESSFNEKIHEKLVSFSRVIKEKRTTFMSDDFSELIAHVDSSTFLYCDPPYLITLGSYNDGKRGFNGWNENDEIRLQNFLDEVTKIGGKFMLSNVINHKGKVNKLLVDWIKRNNYKVIECTEKVRKTREEIIVVNY
jgi:adenine-specific DNA-methyltransferase